MPEIILEINDVRKSYVTKQHTVHALDGVTIAIKKGEVFGLLGQNGAGKTTLSSIIATLHPPTSGDILYRGTSIYKDLNRYRRQLGFCPQKPNLDPELSVEENLVFAGRYYLMGQEKIAQRVHLLMTQLKLGQYAGFKVNALSGGNKQKVLIARALIHEPEVVILDEPTVGLDPDIRRQLWDIIAKLRDNGITVILTTHYLDEAEVLCDRVCILKEGKVLEIETVAQLRARFHNKKLEEVYMELTGEKAQ